MEIHSCPSSSYSDSHPSPKLDCQHPDVHIITPKMYVLWRIHEFMYEGAVEGRGSGAALRSLVDLGLSLGGGPGGEAPGS